MEQERCLREKRIKAFQGETKPTQQPSLSSWRPYQATDRHAAERGTMATPVRGHKIHAMRTHGAYTHRGSEAAHQSPGGFWVAGFGDFLYS